jgi:uncharacterized repeat protein (TIGR03803 family)
MSAETILYAFKGIPDGATPQGGLVADKDGSLYGTTQAGGLDFQEENLGAGTVFKLTPRRSGGYAESIIYRFGASGADDAWFPQAGGLTIDHKGALYGATYAGGLLTGSPQENWFRYDLQAHAYSEKVLDYRGAPR